MNRENNYTLKIRLSKSVLDVRLLIFATCLLFLGGTQTYAQLQSIEPYFGYSTSLSNRLNVNNADAVGGGIKIQFKLYDKISLRLNTGYKLYSISQENAIEQWEWIFWDDRYANTIQSNLNAFKELSVRIGAIQKMDVIPVLLDFKYAFELNDKFTLVPAVGGGVYFYTRRLYIVESWTKRFEELDYNFDYSYRNFAPDKSGNPALIFTGLEINYKLFEYFHLKYEINYSHLFSTKNSLGFSDFPHNDELNFNLGINILY